MNIKLNIYSLMFLALLPNFMFIPSITVLANHYETSFSIMQLSVSLYMVASASLQIVLGPLSDKYGRRPVLLACLAILIISSLGCIFSTSTELFFIFRMLQATAVSGMVIGKAIVIDVFNEKNVIKILSQIAIVLGISSILGPAIGGLLIDLYSWTAIFYFVIGIGISSFLYNFFILEETNKQLVNNLFDQMINYKNLISSRRFWVYSFIGGFSSSTFFMILISIPYIGEVLYHLSSFQSSLLLIIITSGFIIGSFLSPILINSFSERKILYLSIFASFSGTLISLFLYITFPQYILCIFGPFFFIGLSNGLISPIALSKVLGIRDDSRGAASGLNGAFIIGFGAIYSALGGYLLGYHQKVEILYFMICGSLILTYISILYTDEFKHFLHRK